LTVAVLIVFFVLTLTALLLLVGLTGLAALLTGLTTLLTGLTLSALTLPILVTLLILFIHIVCHEKFLLRKRGLSPRLRNLST
jgi:hypothetical protein